MLEEDQKPKSYQRKSKDYSIRSNLSSIREEMKEFCDGMDRFVDENKIVFKNGEVEGFWSERKTANENPQDESVDEIENRETEDKVSASEEDKLRWWCGKERKLKIKEILRKREDEARKNKMKLEDTEARKNPDHSSPDDKNQTADIPNNIQSVCDSKTSSTNALQDSTKTYSEKDAANEEKSRIDVGVEKLNTSSIENVLPDLSLLDKKKASNNISSLEEKMPNIILQITNSTDFDEQSSKCENIVDANNKSVKTETLEDRFANLSLESLEERKTIDESDDDSFRTATSVQEDSQSLDNNQESSRSSNTLYMKDNCGTDCGLTDNESINDVANSHKKIDEEHNGAICENKKSIDKMEKFSDKLKTSNSESKCSKPESNIQIDLLGRATDRSSLERTSQSFKLTGKRIREAEDIEVSKKSFFGEEIHSGKKPEQRRPRSQISERCRQHVIEETRKFVKKTSPLIDKCIASLIEENSDKKLCHKYDRRSLGEFPPFNFASKIDFKKSASEERSTICDKYKNESTNVKNLCSQGQELIDSVSAASINNLGKTAVNNGYNT